MTDEKKDIWVWKRTRKKGNDQNNMSSDMHSDKKDYDQNAMPLDKKFEKKSRNI